MMENKTKIALKNKSIFITGVAGFIGSNLAKRLLSTVEGVKVVGLDNMNNYYDVRLKEARLKELEQLQRIMGIAALPMFRNTMKQSFRRKLHGLHILWHPAGRSAGCRILW